MTFPTSDDACIVCGQEHPGAPCSAARPRPDTLARLADIPPREARPPAPSRLRQTLATLALVGLGIATALVLAVAVLT